MCCIELVSRANNFAYKTYRYDLITKLSAASDEQVSLICAGEIITMFSSLKCMKSTDLC